MKLESMVTNDPFEFRERVDARKVVKAPDELVSACCDDGELLLTSDLCGTKASMIQVVFNTGFLVF